MSSSGHEWYDIVEELVKHYVSDTSDNMDGWEELAVRLGSPPITMENVHSKEVKDAQGEALKWIEAVLKDFVLYCKHNA